MRLVPDGGKRLGGGVDGARLELLVQGELLGERAGQFDVVVDDQDAA